MGSSSSSRSGASSSSLHSATRRRSPPERTVTSASPGGQRSASMACSMRASSSQPSAFSMTSMSSPCSASSASKSASGSPIAALTSSKRVSASRIGLTASSTLPRTSSASFSGGSCCRMPDRVAGRERRVAVRGLLEAGHDLEHRRLAGTVGADDADLGAGQERQGDVVQDHLVAVRLAGTDHGVDVLSHWADRAFRRLANGSGPDVPRPRPLRCRLRSSQFPGAQCRAGSGTASSESSSYNAADPAVVVLARLLPRVRDGIPAGSGVPDAERAVRRNSAVPLARSGPTVAARIFDLAAPPLVALPLVGEQLADHDDRIALAHGVRDVAAQLAPALDVDEQLLLVDPPLRLAVEAVDGGRQAEVGDAAVRRPVLLRRVDDVADDGDLGFLHGSPRSCCAGRRGRRGAGPSRPSSAPARRGSGAADLWTAPAPVDDARMQSSRAGRSRSAALTPPRRRAPRPPIRGPDDGPRRPTVRLLQRLADHWVAGGGLADGPLRADLGHRSRRPGPLGRRICRSIAAGLDIAAVRLVVRGAELATAGTPSGAAPT